MNRKRKRRGKEASPAVFGIDEKVWLNPRTALQGCRRQPRGPGDIGREADRTRTAGREPPRGRPGGSIDYVIVHELCHLIHHNHSRDFYHAISAALPDWEERKSRLERLLS